MAGMSFSITELGGAAAIINASGLVNILQSMLDGNLDFRAFLAELESSVTDPAKRQAIIRAIVTVGGVRLAAEALNLKKSFGIGDFKVRL